MIAAEGEHGRRLGVQLSEIVAQQLRGAAGVRILGWKDDYRIDGKSELDKLAFPAIQQGGRKPRQLARHFADRHHLVDGRHVAQRQHGFETLITANLTAFHRDAPPGAGATSYFGRKQARSPLQDFVTQRTKCDAANSMYSPSLHKASRLGEQVGSNVQKMAKAAVVNRFFE